MHIDVLLTPPLSSEITYPKPATAPLNVWRTNIWYLKSNKQGLGAPDTALHVEAIS